MAKLGNMKRRKALKVSINSVIRFGRNRNSWLFLCRCAAMRAAMVLVLVVGGGNILAAAAAVEAAAKESAIES